MSAETVEQTIAAPSLSPAADAWRRLRRNKLAMLCGLYIVVLIFIALFANALAPYDYAFQDSRRYSSLPAPPDSRHLLGVDDLGRDVLSRLLHGARISLTVSLVVVVIEALIGVTLGLIAGYRGGRTDLFLMRVTDVMFAFPDLLFAILLSAIVRSGGAAVPAWLIFLTLFASLGLVAWPGMARLVRGQVLSLREKEFIEAARAVGVRDSVILRRHLLPNLLGTVVIVQVTQDVAGMILAEATLSFLGLGVPPPFASWGRMIFEALPYMKVQPLLLLLPGLALALTVMAFNFFGDALRDALDPRLRQ
jgi:ABC-type dipeptide/oligopeptide/nickel transport system permease subunit